MKHFTTLWDDSKSTDVDGYVTYTRNHHHTYANAFPGLFLPFWTKEEKGKEEN